ncbi:DUF899-domain-containing protein [Zopfia rhizophila CBS 207.26]|uniref:DUF899-domain-containing protein n=1 Tax=Zopfia rhizophila CBS 207.26 TaxID=1314779 RepID=A0A6A6EGD8_9PEZI|nr:DUF899-domain-containing protein [Zopfia rhizophila CBS 207.26]
MSTQTQTIPDPAFHKWPASASNDYVAARRDLLEKEWALRNQIEEVAAQRRALPAGPILPTYTFEEGPWDLNSSSPTQKVTLADVAKSGELGHKTLVVYHMMMGENATKACPACSMFVDGLNGVAKHLSQHFNLAVIAKAPLPAIRTYALKRGWHNLRFLSSFDNTFNKDMGVEAPEWISDMPQGPGMSVFRYEDGQIRFLYQTTPHFAGPEVIRGMDLLTPVWNMLDITPEGRGDWNPGFDYVEKWDGVKF